MTEQTTINIEDHPFGLEMLMESASGRVKRDNGEATLITFESPTDLTLRGDHMSITIQRVYLGLALCNNANEVSRFTAVQLLFHNVSDYPLRTIDDSKMIDSEGFQHTSNDPHYSYSRTLQGLHDVEKMFVKEDWTLMDHAKTKGWLWFDGLRNNVVPQRFVFSVAIHDPGQTSGWVRDKEVFEYFIKSHSAKRLDLRL
ncbi:MAG: hypothetical protein K2X81_05865 [Candidatus Obscuribacterales bacterium]|nr:hypothetical protein [Candidatus Obscuribacterales bacterium]